MANLDRAAIFIKIPKLVINIIVLSLYRTGDNGHFMGLTFNKNRDAEALAGAVFIGFLIFNIIQLVSYFLDRREIKNTPTSEILTNSVGGFLWLVTGIMATHFWIGFQHSNHLQHSANPRVTGIIMGGLSILNAAIYTAEAVILGLRLIRAKSTAPDTQYVHVRQNDPNKI